MQDLNGFHSHFSFSVSYASSIKLCIDITSMSLAWSTLATFTSLMQSVNEAQFLNIIFLALSAAASNVFPTVIVPLR